VWAFGKGEGKHGLKAISRELIWLHGKRKHGDAKGVAYGRVLRQKQAKQKTSRSDGGGEGDLASIS